MRPSAATTRCQGNAAPPCKAQTVNRADRRYPAARATAP